MDTDRLRTEILTVSGTDRFEYLDVRAGQGNGDPGLVITARHEGLRAAVSGARARVEQHRLVEFAVNFGGRVITLPT